MTDEHALGPGWLPVMGLYGVAGAAAACPSALHAATLLNTLLPVLFCASLPLALAPCRHCRRRYS